MAQNAHSNQHSVLVFDDAQSEMNTKEEQRASQPPKFCRENCTPQHDKSDRGVFSEETFFGRDVMELFANLPQGEELERLLIANLEGKAREASSTGEQFVDTIETEIAQSGQSCSAEPTTGCKRKSSADGSPVTPCKRFRTETAVSQSSPQTSPISAEEATRLQRIGELTRKTERGLNLTPEELRFYVPDREVRGYREQFEDIIVGMQSWSDDEVRDKLINQKVHFLCSHTQWHDGHKDAKKQRNKENRKRRATLKRSS